MRSRPGAAASEGNLADSSAALVGQCDVVATCLPGPTEMEQVCLGPLRHFSGGSQRARAASSSLLVLGKIEETAAGQAASSVVISGA
jgi:3-hydroxyisobutyrate dehydrogenase-like beta-hydroxyacid dehydrogenase